MPRDAIRSSTSRLLRRAQCECTFRHFIGVSPMQFRHYYTCNNVRYAFQRIFSRFSWWSRVAKHLPYYFRKKRNLATLALTCPETVHQRPVYDEALNWAHFQQAASWPATFARLRAFTRLLVLSATLAYLGQQSSAEHDNVRQNRLDDDAQANEINEPRLLSWDAATSRQKHLHFTSTFVLT